MARTFGSVKALYRAISYQGSQVGKNGPNFILVVSALLETGLKVCLSFNYAVNIISRDAHMADFSHHTKVIITKMDGNVHILVSKLS